MDGTLADSLPVLRRVFHQFLESCGHRGSDREFDELNGVPLQEVVARVKDQQKLKPAHAELLSRYKGMVSEAYGEVPPTPGARELVGAAVQAGIPVAVVSSAPVRFVQSWLEKTGLAAMISAVVGGDCVARGKPHPDPYLLALEQTGCDAEASTAVEDSKAGAMSAVLARLETYVVGPVPDDGTGWPAVAGFVASLDQVRSALHDV